MNLPFAFISTSCPAPGALWSIRALSLMVGFSNIIISIVNPACMLRTLLLPIKTLVFVVFLFDFVFFIWPTTQLPLCLLPMWKWLWLKRTQRLSHGNPLMNPMLLWHITRSCTPPDMPGSLGSGKCCREKVRKTMCYTGVQGRGEHKATVLSHRNGALEISNSFHPPICVCGHCDPWIVPGHSELTAAFVLLIKDQFGGLMWLEQRLWFTSSHKDHSEPFRQKLIQ